MIKYQAQNQGEAERVYFMLLPVVHYQGIQDRNSNKNLNAGDDAEFMGKCSLLA